MSVRLMMMSMSYRRYFNIATPMHNGMRCEADDLGEDRDRRRPRLRRRRRNAADQNCDNKHYHAHAKPFDLLAYIGGGASVADSKRDEADGGHREGCQRRSC